MIKDNKCLQSYLIGPIFWGVKDLSPVRRKIHETIQTRSSTETTLHIL